MKLGGNMQTQNSLFNTDNFKNLANTHEPLCLSVYIPTFRAGKGVKEEFAQKNLKNIIKQVRELLHKRNLNENETEVFLRPLINLLDEKDFWANQSDGLAIFYNSENNIELFEVPIHFTPHYYLSDHYYLKPLVPMLNTDDTFYILSISPEKVQLHESTPYTIAEVDTSDFPQSLKDVVGSELEPPTLQHQSGSGTNREAIYHGHGGGKDDANEELIKYLQAIDKQLNDLLPNEEVPLILACDTKIFGHYKKISKYKNLADELIAGNPGTYTALELHEQAKRLLSEHFGKEKELKKDRFRDFSATGKALTDIADIVPAAVHGRVDTLFIQSKKDSFGLYDKENNTVIIENNKQTQNASLYNLAAIHTVLNNGRVYLLDENDMPLNKTNANALLRY